VLLVVGRYAKVLTLGTFVMYPSNTKYPGAEDCIFQVDLWRPLSNKEAKRTDTHHQRSVILSLTTRRTLWPP